MTRARRNLRLAVLVVIGVLAGTLATSWARPAAALSLIAVPDTLSIVHDVTTTVPAPGVLKNDVTILATTAVLDSPTTHGTVSLASNGGYTYKPDPGFVGTDVFRYHDFDGRLPTNTTTVTITVRNTAPVAEDDRESANAGRKETVEAPGVLENDEDPDGDDLHARLVAGPDHGVLIFRPDGSFDYTAEPGFDADDVFTYVATDGIAESAVTEVVMHVSASGSTPAPTTPPSPAPTPLLTLPPLPIPTLPPIPLPIPSPRPTVPGTGDPTPGPDATESPRPEASTRPSPSPAGSAEASAAPGDPGSTNDPGSGAGGAGAGRATGGPGGGGSASGGSSAGGTGADGPVFTVGGSGPAPIVPIVGAEFAGFDSIDWAVPALTLTVPGLLLMLAVIAQLSAGAFWLPVVRRGLGAFGLGRHRGPIRPA